VLENKYNNAGIINSNTEYSLAILHTRDWSLTNLDVRHRGKRLPDTSGQSRQGQKCSDTKRDSTRDGVRVQPEGDPGNGHDEDGRNVSLKQMVSVLSPEAEACRQSTEVTW